MQLVSVSYYCENTQKFSGLNNTNVLCYGLEARSLNQVPQGRNQDASRTELLLEALRESLSSLSFLVSRDSSNPLAHSPLKASKAKPNLFHTVISVSFCLPLSLLSTFMTALGPPG